jgi:RTX calcium-binding nonapeptide repeat (4 copies)
VKVAVASVLLSLAFPAVVEAAQLELRGNQVVYTAGAGEGNDVHFQHWETWWGVQDAEGVSITPVPPCEWWPPHQGVIPMARCPDWVDNITSAVVDLGDGNDSSFLDENTSLSIPVSLLGGPGNDRLTMHSSGPNTLDGGSGNDVLSSEGGHNTLIGGDGNDQFATADATQDVVGCGPGFDEVIADELDLVAADCESVRRETPGGVWTRADGKAIGVSIDGGALYTNSPDVRLRVRGPDAATHLRISNDGGFESFVSRPISGLTFEFELSSSGPERLPKTVYVRFDCPGLDPNRTFTDDIILDETRPVVRSAQVVRRRHGRVRVALRARDATSGVKSAQFARVRHRPWARIRYRNRVTLLRAPRWVRVRDGAGNVSRWRHVAR